MRPIIDPLLTIPRQNAEPHISWDLTQHPSAAFRNYHLTPDALLRPCAVYSSRRAGRLPLKSLVLILPHLPVEIKIPSLRASSRVPSSYATVWDVLEGLYHGLQTPVGSKELQSLSPSQRATLVDASKLRRPCVPEDETWGHVVRWIDYLSHRRRFLGIRPAMFDELPPGRTLGEVFVVEVGAVW
ncbi:hypothetical protein BD309DRAFT_856624 [Dichomitus squalens]|nr:hypothetical protein BD309DRAFT_856624 [Dichomitus squalens]